MFTSHIIRKRLLQIFSQKAIPSLFSGEDEPLLILAEPPFHFPTELEVLPLPVKVLPQRRFNPNELVQRWPQARVNATQWPYLLYLCEGEAEVRVGITRRMAKTMKTAGQKADSGCLLLRLQAPALLLLPGGVPYSDGSSTHWEQPEPQQKHPSILWIHLSPTGTLCHYCTEEEGLHRSEHPLLIHDPLLPEINHILYDELRNRAPGYQKAALAQLQTLMLRLQRRIMLDQPVIGNTAWPKPSHSAPKRRFSAANSAQSTALLAELRNYIQIHLREPLSLPQLASEANLSPAHLNRLFHSILGTTAMRYVMQLRMEAAREIIHDSPHLPVKEVMLLSGYKHLSHFSRHFTQTFGTTPREFRARERDRK